MNVRRTGILAILFVSLALSASEAGAQSVTEKLLLPIAPGHLPGAHGSEWLTELTITNLGDAEVYVSDRETGACPAMCFARPVPARSTIVVEKVLDSENVRGTFSLIEHGRIADLAVTLRTRDLSRQSENVGNGDPCDLQGRSLFATLWNRGRADRATVPCNAAHL